MILLMIIIYNYVSDYKIFKTFTVLCSTSFFNKHQAFRTQFCALNQSLMHCRRQRYSYE